MISVFSRLSVAYIQHKNALDIAEKNKRFVQENSILREEIREKDIELTSLRNHLLVYKASLKESYARELKKDARSIIQANQQLKAQIEHQENQIRKLVEKLLSVSQNNDSSILELTSPERLVSGDVHSRKSSSAQSRHSSSSGIVVSQPTSASSLRGFNKSYLMSVEDQELHRTTAKDIQESKNYADGHYPLTPIHELSPANSSHDGETLMNESLENNTPHPPRETVERGRQTTLVPVDMRLDSLSESRFGPTECSTERKESPTSVSQSNSQSNSQRSRRQSKRGSIFDFQPAFSSPIILPDVNEEEESDEDSDNDDDDSGTNYAGETAEEEDYTHDSESINSFMNPNECRPSLIASFTESESYRKKISFDDSYQESPVGSSSVNYTITKIDGRIRSSVYGLITDSTQNSVVAEDELNQFLASQALSQGKTNDHLEVIQTNQEKQSSPRENIPPSKKRSTKGSKTASKKTSSKNKKAAPDVEDPYAFDDAADKDSTSNTIIKPSGKRKKQTDSSNQPANKKKGSAVGKKGAKDILPDTSSSPIVKADNRKGKSKVSISTNKSASFDGTLMGSSILGNSGEADTILNTSNRPTRKAKEGVNYNEPSRVSKIRRGDPGWCKA